MTRTRLLSGMATLVVVVIFLSLFTISRQQNLAHDDAPSSNPSDRVIPVAEHPVQLQIELDRNAKKQTVWEGAVHVSEGRVLGVDLVRGSNNSSTEKATFKVRAMRAPGSGKKKRKKNQPRFLSALLRVRLDAPASSKVTVETSRGTFTFQVSDLGFDQATTFLDERTAVSQQTSSVRLTGPNTEDDFPALVRSADGTIWLSYVEYKKGQPLIMEQVANRRFDSMIPKGNGDRIRLVKFDGKAWQKPIDVTAGGLDVWRPTVTVDGKGNVVVAWAEKKNGNWDIFSRTYAPKTEKWSGIVKISKGKGSDFHVVSTTDANGKVWFAWQGWSDGKFHIFVRNFDKTHQSTFSSPGNCWTPSITADSKGNVIVAWDGYNDGSYDIRLALIKNGSTKVISVVDTPKYEAKPHIVCDADDRIWITYEEAGIRWGQDYQGNTPGKVGLKNLGDGLYINRTVKVKCIVNGKVMQPTAKLGQVFAGKLERNKSLPRLVIDGTGGLCLFFRHHPRSGGQGEAWHSFMTRYDGTNWSQPRELRNSSNILDNRPALLPHGSGVLAVHSSDTRTNTRSRDQDDLFATVLNSNNKASKPDLKQYEPERIALPAPPHPNEDQAIARMRKHRIKIGGKTLRMIRGEFHRHTEYTAHRDQDGTLEDSWRYALDAGKLDWMGNGDHDNGFGHEYLWWQIQKICDLFHNGPEFIAAITHERSVVYPSGHRNVMIAKRGIRPLPRLSQQKEILFGTPEEGSPDIKLLYDYLKHFNAICSSHTSGTNMGTDWRDNDPEVEPVVEIYQGHRHSYEHAGAPRSATQQTQIGGYKPLGTVWNALEKGYRLGFQSSSDHVSTHMSYAVALVETPTRQGIIDAFKKRHSYAATDNILVVVRSGDHLMGDEFTTKKRPSLQIEVHGATNIAKVHIVRSNKYVYTAEPNKQKVNLSYTDMDIKPGESHYYYVRIEQSDGNLAWASPLWITYQPGQ
jgi:hypothetical protein